MSEARDHGENLIELLASSRSLSHFAEFGCYMGPSC